MSQSKKKYFPIVTSTACKLKWSWSTLYLNSGITASCHRTGLSEITQENFNEFHNTSVKLSDRTSMLEGQWPKENCAYCRKIEEAGGVSDRIRHTSIPEMFPEELETNPTAINIDPVIVEVFFNNFCNLGCLYCNPELSSSIEAEYRKFGNFNEHGVELLSVDTHFKELIPYFWDWFPIGFVKLKRFHVLGGEPFLQKEFDKLLDMIEKYPNPDCELNVITNLMVPKNRIENYLEKFKKLLVGKKIKRIDITCSIDSWGEQQEYVRWGINLKEWEENFKLLLRNKWIYLNINQTISALTIKTMPDLLVKLTEWRKDRPIGHWFSGVTPGPSYLKNEIFDKSEFAAEVEHILSLMPTDSKEDKVAHEYMKGILSNTQYNGEEIKNLIIFLNEKDRRRNTDWRKTFPWLTKYEDLCGIQE